MSLIPPDFMLEVNPVDNQALNKAWQNTRCCCQIAAQFAGFCIGLRQSHRNLNTANFVPAGQNMCACKSKATLA